MDIDLASPEGLVLKAIYFDAIELFLGFLLFPLAVFPFIFMVLNYLLVYDPLKRGNLENAKWFSMLLGVVELVFGGVVPGVLLLVGFWKLGEEKLHAAEPAAS